MLRPTLLLAFTTALFACDQGGDAPGDVDFRSDGTICIVGMTPPSTTIKNRGFPHPDDPKGLWQQLATENTDEA
ncbi:MAG TPA: hypothetical protein VFG69_14310, partial [Nannocystaceae bacterium]|nr:hypothetical protein [Nannocystaceae bacterium]